MITQQQIDKDANERRIIGRYLIENCSTNNRIILNHIKRIYEYKNENKIK